MATQTKMQTFSIPTYGRCLFMYEAEVLLVDLLFYGSDFLF